ncbi:MAG TPA: hypothetical protein VEP90_10160 [Methylomirabilota bacterium]|nr:hypothetical protein [Methylomirabilota bacterium]
MSFKVDWLSKYCIIIIITILRMVSVLYNSHTQTELGNILEDAVHCIYCNPGLYPHGFLWYAIVLPIAYFTNPTFTMLSFALIDMAILILLIKHPIFYAYFFVSFVSYFVIPQNIPILWLMLLGLYSTPLLSLSIIAKLPVGAPAAIWKFIFTTSLNIVTNFQDDYGLLVFLWLYILIYNLRFDIRKGIKALQHR